MPTTAYLERVLQAVNEGVGPNGDQRELFRSFAKAVGAQIRPPYQARFRPATVAEHLSDLFLYAQTRPDGAVLVKADRKGDNVVLTSVMKDQAFIVDTVRLVIAHHDATFVAGFNVILGMERSAAGTLVGLSDRPEAAESLLRVVVEGVNGDADALVADVRRSLHLATAMVDDFAAINEEVDRAAFSFLRMAEHRPDAADDMKETAEFLRWLLADNFVFMSAARDGERFGFARVDDTWSIDFSDFVPEPDHPQVSIRKGKAESPVHRKGRVDEILVNVPSGGRGEPTALRLQGMFTYRAITAGSRNVPVLRQQLAQILGESGAKPGSHRYKGIANTFDALPTEFLFTASTGQIMEIIEAVLEAQQQQSVRVHLVHNPAHEMAFAILAMPKAGYSDDVRKAAKAIVLDATKASFCATGAYQGRYDTMLVHYYMSGVGKLDEAGIENLLERIRSKASPWVSRISESLEERFGEERAGALLYKYGDAFEDIYRRMRPSSGVAQDVEILEQLGPDQPLMAVISQESHQLVGIRLYQYDDLSLSTILPVLDNFGLLVRDQFADKVQPRGSHPMAIDTFRLLDGAVGLAENGALLVDGIEAVFDRRMPDDEFNKLLVGVGLPWQAVDLIRAYRGYAKQLGLVYTRDRIVPILLAWPDLVRGLWEYFQARFDPAREAGRKKAVKAAEEAVLEGMRSITSNDHDVVFRTLFNLMQSSIRTNFYRTDRKEHYISFKVDVSSVRTMPEPRLMYEIYVHHRDMEGIHLRGGPVARGGIRWSDRDDFRREILDLATTQMVKNVVIVPEGSKGGFFMRQPPVDPAERRRRADELYQILIRGLLDVTDSYDVDGNVVPPPMVVRWDGDDPYLVVAADKGTAHLSDTANRISLEYGFWLGDAFASGGSVGYDHKEVGITARGAWMTVRRHFAEMGMDPDKDVFTCAGVGDTGGDVFGNGVIETDKMKLVAAFNHVHVFIDPNPDPAATFKERKRLFKIAKGWDAYDTSLLSEGGGIYSRKAKSIKLSPQARELLGATQDELRVDQVIRLILRLNVDLMWSGGIGTYFKASTESHADAGDPSNDDVRINANEVNARVIGEGANLSWTQAGRIEYALGGGRLNTDAIDNSGGVDMSDHEVNLKILLNRVVASGRMTMKERNKLLESMTDEVALHVLKNNNAHGLQLSLDQFRSKQDPMRFASVIDWVCTRSGRTRESLRLPTDAVLAKRAAQRQGLTRPELSVLNGHVKMHVFKELMQGDPANIPDFGGKVAKYFPRAVQEGFAADVQGHMLFKAIGMTMTITRVMRGGGVLFFPMLMELTGASADRIAGAWLHAVELVGADGLRSALAGSKAPLDVQYEAWVEMQAAVFNLCAVWLTPGEAGPATEDADAVMKTLAQFARTRGALQAERKRVQAEQYVARKIAPNAANKLAGLSELTLAREVSRLKGPKEKTGDVITRYLAIGESSQILPTLRAINVRQARSRWEPVAIGLLRYRFLVLLRELVQATDVGNDVRLGIDRLSQRLTRPHGPLQKLEADMRAVIGIEPDVATLLAAEARIRAHLAT